MRKDEIIGIARLHGIFGPYAEDVLSNRLERVPRPRTEKGRRLPAQFKITQDLPSKDEYKKLLEQKYTMYVESLIDDAKSEIEMLAEEMREWFDNLTEGLQQTDKAQTIEQTADTLEGIYLSDIPEGLDGVKVVYLPAKNANSREARASEASSMLHLAAGTIQEYSAEVREGESNPEDTSQQDEWEEFAGELESAADEVDCCEFPGMYG